jgi:hypothetical protein
LAPLPGNNNVPIYCYGSNKHLKWMHRRALQLAMTCVAGQTLQFAASADAIKVIHLRVQNK